MVREFVKHCSRPPERCAQEKIRSINILRLTRTAHFAYDPIIRTMRRSAKPDLANAPEEGRGRLLRRFHTLIDRKLKGALPSKQAAELQQIEGAFQSLEEVETAETMRAYEQRHSMMMQKLSELTAELRKMSVGSQSPSQIPQPKAR